MTHAAANPRVAVLGYHKIGPAPVPGQESWYYIPESTFSAQLAHLRDNGWPFIDLPTFLRGLDDPASLPERSALVTFDDGYRSLRREALRTLRTFDAPAIVFVPTAFIGARNTFDTGVEPDEEICSWEDLRELEQNGVAVQSHGVSHRWFSRLSASELETEIVTSKETLERELGRSLDTLAYPYGDCGETEQDVDGILRRAGYRAAFTYKGRPIQLPVSGCFCLERLAMGPDTDLSKKLQG